MTVHSVVHDFTGPPTKAHQTDRDVEMVRRGIEAARKLARTKAEEWGEIWYYEARKADPYWEGKMDGGDDVEQAIAVLDPAAIARGDQ